MRYGSASILTALLAIGSGRCVAETRVVDRIGLVGRSTNDRDADLLDALAQRQRFEDALSICRMLARGANPAGDLAARWAIRQSELLAARQMAQDQFDEADVQVAAKPVADVLNSYPQHRRRFFLLAQTLMVRRSATLHRVLRAAVSPTADRLRDEATASLLETTEELESLVRDIGDARAVLDQQSENRPFALIEDLARLQQELQVEAVSLALMQTELFPSGSDDCIAAATRAEQIADQAIVKLPADTKARREVERLKIESIFRAGQLGRADGELKRMSEMDDAPLSPRWLALQIRLDIAQQRVQQAASRLADYYGDEPNAAPRSIEMDLAKLEFMLRNQPGETTGDWLEAIQARGGTYARRRAEAMALSLLGRSEPSKTPAIDPSIVAAQGQDYLRRGDPGRAAELLAAAAQAETNGDRAIQRATEAAAAFGLVQRHREASSLLAETALANPESKKAPVAHLQAAFLIASNDAQAVDRLESMLRTNLERWPNATTASSVRAWLQKLLTGQQRFVDAAVVATSVPVEQITPDGLDSISAQWRATLQQSNVESSEISRRFLASYQPLMSNQAAAARFPLLAALLVDRGLLQQVASSIENGEFDPFAMALLAYRQQGAEADVLNSPPDDVIADATERLMRDGRQNPVLRESIARLLSRWVGNQDRSFDQAERLLWGGKAKAAIQLLNELVLADPGSVDTTSRAAKLLELSNDPEAVKESIRLWDQLASGAAQGSSLWHEAKLAAIAILRRAGNVTEAQRRARYVLLTSPAIEPAIRRRYEAFTK